jgi:hypothetical protein
LLVRAEEALGRLLAWDHLACDRTGNNPRPTHGVVPNPAYTGGVEALRWRPDPEAERGFEAFLRATVLPATIPLLRLGGEVVGLLAHTDTVGRGADPPDDRSARRRGRGKNVEGAMLKVLTNQPEAASWTSTQWADRLNCSAGTVKETKVWKERLKAVRALQAADTAAKMDRAGQATRGRRGRRRAG